MKRLLSHFTPLHFLIGIVVGVGMCLVPALQDIALAAPQASPPWVREVVDAGGDVGRLSSLQIDSQGQVHIAYIDTSNTALKYACQNGASWQINTIATLTRPLDSVSLALDENNNPHIAYANGQSVYYAYKTGGSWRTELVYAAAAYPVGSVALALGTDDQPQLSWYRGSPPTHLAGILMYGERTKASWQVAVVDSSGLVGLYSDIAVDSHGQPHISYYDISNGDLKYAYRDTHDTWHVQTVDQAGTVGLGTSIALDTSDVPHIAYRTITTGERGNLKYAYRQGLFWHIETVQNTGDVGDRTSLVLSADGRPYIGYLRYLIAPFWQIGRATLVYNDGSAWQYTVVDDGGDVGYGISLGLNAANQPYLSYYDASNDDLKLAHQVPLRYYRIALDHLQSVQGTSMAPGWEQAFLGDEITPFYRPDINGVAYYEFPVLKPATGLISIAEAQAAGFIIVATGEHDYPVMHWDFTGETISNGLRRKAAAAGKSTNKFYKIDALAYAAENSAGELTAVNWQLPPKATGMKDEWLTNPPSFETLWTSDSPEATDEEPSGLGGAFIVSGTLEIPSGLSLSGWESWQELKEGYGQSYRLLLQYLGNQAQKAWEVRDEIWEEGKTLYKGDIEEIPLLWDTESIQTSGAGTAYVTTETHSGGSYPGI
ncbi:MAG: hypothetical protein GXP38_12225, partial [Chloroflexi bacterium]|nr:hypothetical protein [Chloroflexota bacterium]